MCIAAGIHREIVHGWVEEPGYFDPFQHVCVLWITLFCRNGHIWLCIGYFGPFQPVKVASPARPSDQIPTGSWDTNGDLCCQFMTSKLLFLLPYTFHRTRNLIGKSLTGWNCLSWPMFFPLELYNQLPFIIDPGNILSNCGKGQKISNNFQTFYLHRAIWTNHVTFVHLDRLKLK